MQGRFKHRPFCINNIPYFFLESFMEVVPMLIVDLGVLEFFDDEKQEFIYKDGGIAKFEYSLKAIYEWEGKWKKPFLVKDTSQHTNEQMLDLYRTMALTEVPEEFWSNDVYQKINDYIADSQTATIFSNVNGSQNGNTSRSAKINTSEEIYAMMFESGIDISFEERNLNRLLTMLKIIANRQTPPKKMSSQDVMRQNAMLNAKRKAQMKSKG